LFILYSCHIRTEDFMEDDFPHKPGRDALPQASTHSSPCPSNRSVDMQNWLAIFTGSEYAHSCYFVSSIDGQKHWLWWSFFRTLRTDNDIATSDSTN
jgi:hypothetical protein